MLIEPSRHCLSSRICVPAWRALKDCSAGSLEKVGNGIHWVWCGTSPYPDADSSVTFFVCSLFVAALQ